MAGSSAAREDAMATTCEHLADVADAAPEPRTSDGCEECLESGDSWLHLRLCLACRHVGCCDDSPNRHATKHFHETAHPLIRSYEPDEDWWFCYVDDLFFELPDAARAPSHA